MTEQRQPRFFAIREDQLGALQEFIGQLNLPWKTTNPIMQVLISLPEVNVTATPVAEISNNGANKAQSQ